MPVKKLHHPEPTDIPSQLRIYVNRNLRLGSVRAIGFDMDHTLAVYKSGPFERLAFEKARAKLPERGYPRGVLKLKYQPDFVVRGLIVDKQRGNVLKMDRHRYVVQAYHGTRKIPSDMRKQHYARQRIRIGGATYMPVDTLFSLPEISLYAHMVDLLDEREERPNYRQLYDDVRGAMDEAHADDSIKRVIARNPLRFLQVDPALPETLNRMRSQGLRLFLLTNSEGPYTGLIMDRLLSGRIPDCEHWTDFFDLVVVRAEKPAFFGRRDSLRALSVRTLGAAPRDRPRFAFAGGSVRALEEALGVRGDAILFFGDHTYTDILKTKRICGWRTAMIIQRLGEELHDREATREHQQTLAALERRIDRLAVSRDLLERALEGQIAEGTLRHFMRAEGLKGGRQRMPAHLDSFRSQIREMAHARERLEQDIENVFNPYWGQIFRAGREKSHFAAQVETFACIYTSSVSNFLNYPMDKYFVATHVLMPHEF